MRTINNQSCLTRQAVPCLAYFLVICIGLCLLYAPCFGNAQFTWESIGKGTICHAVGKILSFGLKPLPSVAFV